MSKTVVSSWNDFDPLKHVIVGRADHTCIPPAEPATEAKPEPAAEDVTKSEAEGEKESPPTPEAEEKGGD